MELGLSVEELQAQIAGTGPHEGAMEYLEYEPMSARPVICPECGQRYELEEYDIDECPRCGHRPDVDVVLDEEF